jgi:hypothetical protein
LMFTYKNNHYPWRSIKRGGKTQLKVDTRVYQTVEKKGHHLKWNYDSFQIS